MKWMSVCVCIEKKRKKYNERIDLHSHIHLFTIVPDTQYYILSAKSKHRFFLNLEIINHLLFIFLNRMTKSTFISGNSNAISINTRH